ncbi:tubulin polymerization-promoting protein homolog [Culicoides brevitarsis]|uniref:tubulin polymerization-promoting protein homolog n=1 Tax=Culicoides brevitarsis TaxID=469753 RepID=UPI00307B8019
MAETEPKPESPAPAANGSANGAEGSEAKHSLKELFEAYSKFGDPKSDGKSITLSNSDKWFKQAKVFDKKLTTVDTGICFKKMKKKAIDFKSFNEYLEDVVKGKDITAADLKAKLTAAGPPAANATKPVVTGAVSRLTDTSKYTGSHKERFDASGKGKGKEGRVDMPSKDGYVTGYKNKNTFNETH